jgi:hypothetical protein
LQITNVDDGLVKLALLEEQGLQVCDEYCEALKTVMDLYIGIGDADNASMYAKKLASRRWNTYAAGAKLYTTPLAIRSHPLWIKRTKVDAGDLGSAFAGLTLTKAD